jgi:hypothetical protein
MLESIVAAPDVEIERGDLEHAARGFELGKRPGEIAGFILLAALLEVDARDVSVDVAGVGGGAAHQRNEHEQAREDTHRLRCYTKSAGEQLSGVCSYNDA